MLAAFARSHRIGNRYAREVMREARSGMADAEFFNVLDAKEGEDTWLKAGARQVTAVDGCMRGL